MNPSVKLCIAVYITALLSTSAIATGTQCQRENGETFNSNFAGWTTYYLPGWVTNTGDGIWDSISFFNSSRPVGSCSGYTSSTSKALGPLQVVGSQNQLFEVTFYDEFNGVSLPDGRGGCYASGGGGGWARWTFGPLGPLRGSAGTFCVTPVEQSKSLSLTVSSPSSKELRPVGTGGNSTAELVAKVVEGTTPKAGLAVQFTTDATANSGGHDHDNPPRPKAALAPASGTTDANGEVRFRFNATQISGVHTITATCNDCVNKTAVEKVTVKVPGLLNIFTLPFRDPNWAYPGVGQTDNHLDNHYLTVAAAARLLDISRKYQKIWPTAPRLTLNDGSLVWGGKFDIDGTWDQNTQRHNEHRIGDNVDVRANNAQGAVPANIRDAVFRWLRKTSRQADSIPADFVIESVNPLHEGIGKVNEHFHLRLGN